MNGTDPIIHDGIDGEPWTVDEVRTFATGLRDEHDPNEQIGNPYNFCCAVCHYVKHPCDTFSLASIVLALLPGTETP